MSAQSQQETQTISKRPRPVLSCLECRRKKLKCDRLLPCQQCLKLNQASNCKYAPGQDPQPRSRLESLASTPVSASASTSIGKRMRSDESNETTIDSSKQVRDLNDRVRRLEEALQAQQNTQSAAVSHHGQVQAAGALHSSRDTSILEDSPIGSLPFPIMDENFSVFKQFEDTVHFSGSLKRKLQEPNLNSISAQLRAIHRIVNKPGTANPTFFASYTNFSDIVSHMIQLLPVPRTRDKLINLYFENFEHCTRIIHKPDFLLQTQKYDQGKLQLKTIEYFIPALIGILCIASNLNTYPECDLPNLCGHQSGSGGVHLMNAWYDLVIRRDGVTMCAIQVKLLAMKSQQFQSLNGMDLWIASGQLVRQGMAQQLNKEGLPHMSNYEAEIRRCLWLAILEQDLALSISCDAPPLCPLYDLSPPVNCDDDELSKTSTEPPPHHPTHKWTDGLCHHILGTTFNQRLKAYKHRFDTKSAAHYTATLEYAQSLERIIQDLPPLFRLDYMADQAANTPGRLMAQMDLDIALRRPLIATYAPYGRSTSVSDVYREARIPWVQSNLVVICFQDLFDPQFPMIDVPRPVGYWDYFYTAYRYDVLQSLNAMLVEANHLKTLESIPASQAVSTSASTAASSPTRFMRWNFEAMMKSIEDTLSPMKRRIGQNEGDLQCFAKYAVLYDCLRTPYGDDAGTYILEGLQGWICEIRKKLEQQGYVVEPNSELLSGTTDDTEWLSTFLGLEA